MTRNSPWLTIGLGLAVLLTSGGGGSAVAFTRPGTPPEPDSSDAVIVTKTQYDDAGLPHIVTDNAGIQTRREYDALGRPRKVVENYVDGDPDDDFPDEDRVTTYTYNAAGQIVTQTADLEGSGGDQTTIYVYAAELTDKGSPVKSNTLLRAIIYPDADDTPGSGSISNGADTDYDRVELTYYADGSLATRKDQRGTVLTYTYTPGSGLRESQRVTTLGSGGDDAVRSITYAYDAMLRLVKVTSHADVTADPDDTSDVVNQVAYTYDGLGRLTAEHQEHDGVVTGGSHAITHTYDDTTAGDVLTSGGRLTAVTYPNGRNIHWTYAGHNSIDDAISRANALADDDGSGDPGDPIVTYSYLGSGGAAIKDYPTPQVRLSYADGSGGDPYDASSGGGWDRFGRVVDHGWVNYAGSPADVTRFTHAYDHASNRLYSERAVYTSHSEVYSYDELHRLVTYRHGAFDDSTGTIRPHWTLNSRDWSLDTLGNQLAVDRRESADWTTAAYNKANEIVTRKVKGNLNKKPTTDTFGNSTTAANFEMPAGATDNFDINTTTAGRLTITSVAADTFNGETEEESRAILLWGEATGPRGGMVEVYLPVTAGAEAGFVFGYKSPNDYWVTVNKPGSGGTGQAKTYHVIDGVRYLQSVTTHSNTGAILYANSRSQYIFWQADLTISDGFPSGRIGLYANTAGTTFDNLTVWFNDQPLDNTGRWINHMTDRASNVLINPSTDRTGAKQVSINPTVAFLDGVRAGRFQTTFSLRQVSGNPADVMFLFNARSEEHYDQIEIHFATANAPHGWRVRPDVSLTAVAGTRTNANVPTIDSGAVLWVRVTSDGSTVSVKTIRDDSGTPSEGDWSSASNCFSSSNFDFSAGGGMFGFGTDAPSNQIMAMDDLTIKTDRDANGSYETTEAIEAFTLDGSGYAEETLTYDAAGNLTYDGVFAYTYDAWNRQVKVVKAYRNPASPSTVALGSVISVSTYDGTGRRIVKAVQNSADLDCTYHYYFRGQSVIEERNGSDMVLKHYVWNMTSGDYIDELVQTAVNGDPVDDPDFDPNDPDHDPRNYWTLHNANYNVMAIVDASGGLVERYEYTPYGERQVYFSAGSNDPLAMSPTSMSQRVDVNSVDQPYGLMDVGHQGLFHDEEASLVYNRARMLHPQLGRFVQRDPLGYVDGMGLYEYLKSNPYSRFDPLGTGTALTPQGQLALIVELLANGMSITRIAATLGIPAAEVAKIALAAGAITIPQLISGDAASQAALASALAMSADELAKQADDLIKQFKDEVEDFLKKSCPCPCAFKAAAMLGKAAPIFKPDPNWPRHGMAFTTEYEAAIYEKYLGSAGALILMNRARAQAGLPPLGAAPNHLQDVKNRCKAVRDGIADTKKCLAWAEGKPNVCKGLGGTFASSAVAVGEAVDKACKFLD